MNRSYAGLNRARGCIRSLFGTSALDMAETARKAKAPFRPEQPLCPTRLHSDAFDKENEVLCSIQTPNRSFVGGEVKPFFVGNG